MKILFNLLIVILLIILFFRFKNNFYLCILKCKNTIIFSIANSTNGLIPMNNIIIINNSRRTIRTSVFCIWLPLLITFFTQKNEASAQQRDTSQLKSVYIQHCYGYKTTSLRIGNALGYGVYRDMGTAPLRFKGAVLQPNIGLEFGGMRNWTTTIDLFTSAGVFEDAVEPKLNFGSFDISNTLRFKMTKIISELWSYENERKLHLGNEEISTTQNKRHYACVSVGFGAANFFDVTVNSEYENAAAGVSEFVGPEVSLRADLSLNAVFNKFSIDKFDKQFHTEIGLMPVAAVLRPGYSYIDNYTASQPVLSSLFDEFQWNLKPFAGLWSDIGFDIINGYNRISFSYLWSYHSSGNSGAWRFDHATHLFLIDFTITLKQKSTEWTKAKEI